MTDFSVSMELVYLLVGAFAGAIIAVAALRARRPKPQPKQEERELRKPAEAAEAELTAPPPVEDEIAPPKVAEPVVPTEPVRVSWKQRLVAGLKRTHGQIFRSIDELLLPDHQKDSRDKTLESLFESLILADVGVATSELLVKKVREQLSGTEGSQSQIIKQTLRSEILAILKNVQPDKSGTIESPAGKPHVVLMVGVNGVGKTTTAGKLAFKANQRGLRAVVGAADTYRAAAVEQLKIWAERSGAEFVQLKEGSDPASVAFEAVKVARQRELDLCLVDTAGRLHNRNDLMQELAKIRRVMSKEDTSAPHEVLLVLDATTGQNALQQAKVFREIVNITGLVITKLDGTAKGGVAIAVVNELKIPIRYIGVGETVEDLEAFSPEEFVDALFAEEN